MGPAPLRYTDSRRCDFFGLSEGYFPGLQAYKPRGNLDNESDHSRAGRYAIIRTAVGNQENRRGRGGEVGPLRLLGAVISLGG
jgi:hypothetical protein